MKRMHFQGIFATGGRAMALVAMAGLLSSAAPPPDYTDLATPFEQVATATAGEPEATRIAAVRDKLDALLRGIYPPGAHTDRLIARALAGFPAQQAGYDRVIRDFPAALKSAVAHFRKVFPDFTSPLPIFLYHSLGQRDGGSAYLDPGHRQVALFGADLIAKYHADDSLQPFLDHELFHLEHARTFADCDQLWCPLWQEGLAVDAAAAMTPGATDHQLLLDIPTNIRTSTDARWATALCFVSTHFDDTSEAVIGQALMGGGKPPSGLPDRFGYYVGYRLAQATGRPVPSLARLDHQAARRLLRATLIRLMKEAEADCAPPPVDAAITHRSPRAA
jgi:hypothetical protein